MRPSQFLDKQQLDVIQWSEPEAGALACRYPMLDAEIQAGAWLSVRESEMALFVVQEHGADIFGPGLYALNAENLPVLAAVKNWTKGYASPFKSDIYFFSMTEEFNQMWGTSAPIALRGAARSEIHVRAYGSYSYRIADIRTFFMQVSGGRENYFVYDLEDRLRKIIVAQMADTLGSSGLSHVELTANVAALGNTLVDRIRPAFAALGLELTQFAVQAISSQDELPLPDDRQMSCTCCGASMRAENDVLKCDYCHVVVASAVTDGSGLSAELGHACPVCEILLLPAIVGGASLSYCTRCDGMLVPMEELDALIAASRALPSGTVPAAPAELRDTYDCPGCGRSMGVSFYGEHVAIDSCEDCSLNWLDHSELARIAHAPEFSHASSGACAARECGEFFQAAQTGLRTEFNAGA